MTTEFRMESILRESLELNEEIENHIIRLSTFEEAGIMTYNKGVVLELSDGSEFQITIVKSN